MYRLGRNYIGDEGMTALSTAVSRMTGLTTLEYVFSCTDKAACDITVK